MNLIRIVSFNRCPMNRLVIFITHYTRDNSCLLLWTGNMQSKRMWSLNFSFRTCKIYAQLEKKVLSVLKIEIYQSTLIAVSMNKTHRFDQIVYELITRWDFQLVRDDVPIAWILIENSQSIIFVEIGSICRILVRNNNQWNEMKLRLINRN